MIKKADKQLIKSFNENTVLNLIRNEGPISRTDISKITHISKVAIYEIISRLMEAGFVLEIGKEEDSKRVGKRPTLIKLHPGNHVFVGIEIKRTEARVAIANIEAKILRMDTITYDVGASADYVINLLFDKIDRLFMLEQISMEKLISIAVGVPGLIDYDNGRIRFADTLRGWGKKPLASRFHEKYNVPTLIENDVKLITLGEVIAGAGRAINNLICIWIGEGMGAGIVVDGNLHRGDGGSAGEIGYLEISECLASLPDSKYLYKGQKNIGTILSEAYFLDVVRTNLAAFGDRMPTLDELLQIFTGPSGSDRDLLLEILDEYAYYLSIISMTFITTINPRNIILCGHLIEKFGYITEKTQQLINRKLEKVPFGDCLLKPGQLKDKAGIMGAVELALKSVFKSPIAMKGRIVDYDHD